MILDVCWWVEEDSDGGEMTMVPFHFFDLVPEWPSFKCFFLDLL